MLYSIIPPILLVLSVIGIIIFFVKKAPEAEKLSLELERGEMIRRDLIPGGAGFQGRKAEKSNAAKQVSLVILEKIIAMFRALFLSLEKTFASLTKKIKDGQSGRSEKKEKLEYKEDSILEKMEKYEERNVSPSGIEKFQNRKVSEAADAKVKEKAEEKSVKPMVSERVVVPNSGMRQRKEQEIKDRLEELLIERIAINSRDTEAYERLGEYYFDIENFEHAKECFKQVIKLDPTNRSVKYKMKKLETILSR